MSTNIYNLEPIKVDLFLEDEVPIELSGGNPNQKKSFVDMSLINNNVFKFLKSKDSTNQLYFKFNPKRNTNVDEGTTYIDRNNYNINFYIQPFGLESLEHITLKDFNSSRRIMAPDSINLDYIDKLKLSYSFPKEHYRDFILQTIDETHSKAPNHDKYHRHENEWTYVMYLNDNYQGGEIEFTNGTIIKPQVGDVIYFSPEEGHRVKPPYDFTEQYFKHNGKSILMNKRWSLVGFMNSDIINENKKTCLI